MATKLGRVVKFNVELPLIMSHVLESRSLVRSRDKLNQITQYLKTPNKVRII